MIVSRGLRTLRVLARGYGESRPYRAELSPRCSVSVLFGQMIVAPLSGAVCYVRFPRAAPPLGAQPAAMMNPALIGRFHPPLRGDPHAVRDIRLNRA